MERVTVAAQRDDARAGRRNVWERPCEATDEAMARACARWAEVATYANPEGWAYRVGLNWARSQQRRRRWRDVRPVPDRPAPEVPDDHDLTVALGRLTVEQWAVVVCRYLLDWSEDDTAAVLGIAAGTSRAGWPVPCTGWPDTWRFPR